MPLTREDPIGFAGTGNLGEPMVLALLDAGWSVTVLDREPERLRACADAGAVIAGSAAELTGCRALLLAVPDDDAVTELVDAVLPELADGSTVLVHSTILPETARALAKRAADKNVAVLDAPVSGGAERARAGRLTVMAGGRREHLDEVRELLAAVADEVVYAGPAGAGAAVKLANQLMMFANLAGAYEGLELAAAYDVDEQVVLEAVGTSTGDSWILRNWGFFDEVARAYEAGGTPVAQRPWSKDLWDVVAAARGRDLRLPVAGLLAQHLADRVEAHARKGAAG